jgi:predicted nucleic acid-binding protein
MPPVLFDTSLYISALRRGENGVFALRRVAPDASVWLSVVVLEELYAGAGDRDRHLIEGLELDFEMGNRILIPTLEDWTAAGWVLARLAAKYDYEQIGRGRLTNDALVAMSAGRLGVTVITSNKKDFSRLAEFRNFQWQVATF